MDDCFWPQIHVLLHEQRVIPVVGQTLSMWRWTAGPPDSDEHLAGRLAVRFGIEGQAPRSLDELAGRHLAQGGALEDILSGPQARRMAAERGRAAGGAVDLGRDRGLSPLRLHHVR